MNIINKVKNDVPFSDIEIGECFATINMCSVCIKINDIISAHGVKINAIGLDTGDYRCFTDNMGVRRVESKLIVE